MPNPAPKASRRANSHDVLMEAINAVEGGMTVTAASKQFSIPRQTLKDKISGKYGRDCRMGRPSILSSEEETTVVAWVIAVGSAGFPVTKEQLLASVNKLMKNLKRDNPFAESLGEKWLALFIKRHPEISPRVSQVLTTSRANVTEEQIRKWFAEVNEYITSKDLMVIFDDPSRIYNCDETAFFLCPKGKKVFVRKGEKHVYTITGNDEKECLTTLVMANAAGELAPPMIVYSYERIPASVVQQLPSLWGVGKSENGWMTGETFFEYITNVFFPWLVANNVTRPVILFVDGHVSHLTLHLSEFCSANGIELISLYPNATHILQPMDVAVFHPLKSCWRKTVDKWRSENGAAKIKKEDFAPLLKKVLDESVKPKTVQSGSETNGLLKLDPNMVNFSTLIGSKSRKAVETPYSHSRWLELRGHLTFLETKIGQERLGRFKEEEVSNNEKALYDVWTDIRKEVSFYRERLDKQDCKENNQEKNGNSVDPTVNNDIVIPAEYIVIAEATEEHQNITVVNEEFADLSFPFEIEVDLPFTELDNYSIPSLSSTPQALGSSLQNLEDTPSREPITFPISSSPALPSSSSSLTPSVPFIAIPSTSSAPTQSVPFLTLPSTTSTPIQSMPSPTKETNPSQHPSLSTPTKSSESNSIITPAEMKEKVRTPFKSAFFWPEANPKRKKIIKKIRLPSAATSDEWKTYYKIIIENEKKKAQINKEQRREERETKAKIKKEEEECRKNNKRPNKRKLPKSGAEDP